MFSAVSLRLFVCQEDNFRTTKHGMMKCKGLVHCIMNSAELEFGGDSPLPVCAPQMWRLATTLEKSAQATVGIDHSVVTTFFSLKPVFHGRTTNYLRKQRGHCHMTSLISGK